MERRHRFPKLVLIAFFSIAALVSFCCLRIFTSKKVTDDSNNVPTTTSQQHTEAYVPVTSFDDPRSSITAAEFELAKAGESSIRLIAFSELTPDQKLLAVDDAYYLDDFTGGADFRTVEVGPSTLSTYRSPQNIFSFAQTGVTALTRAITTKLQQVGDGTYFASQISDFLSSKDLTHLSNEVSFADDCPGGTGTTTLCADWRTLDTITAVGADIIELTGNHNNDYSASNNFTTIQKYHQLGLQTFGGGADETSAAIPLELDQKGTKLTLLGYNQSTSTKANGQGASGDQPGANIYNENQAVADIAAAKARGDFVIVDVQYFECYCYPEEGAEMPACDAPISGQTEFFRHLVDLGADMVVGTQAHQPQTYELYHGKPIYYGLGNLFFDQTYWPGTTRSLILTHYFYEGQYLQTRITPTVYDTTYQPHLMPKEDAQAFLARLLESQPE